LNATGVSCRARQFRCAKELSCSSKASSGGSYAAEFCEVDLKRPGRVDVKIPLFPTSTKREGFDLLRKLLKKRSVELPADSFAALERYVPLLLTPGAAEALAVKIYRLVRTSNLKLDEVMLSSLREYLSPVAFDVMQFQINLAVAEASDLEFVPAPFLPAAKPTL
jgi:hypothetical protein